MATDFQATRAMFDLPDGVIYLDGNSLGPLPKGVLPRMQAAIGQEWGAMLVKAWNDAGWMEKPRRVGDRIARLVGAEPGSITMGDTLSIKVFQALSAALKLNPQRRVILSDTGNFPSDLYIAQGLTQFLGQGYTLRTVAPEDLMDAIDDTIAATLITEVDYRSGRKHDMAALTAKAHAHGALTVWDLAHSAGAVPIDLAGAKADFAAGCTYKYLNAGPGGPAFVYVAPRHAQQVQPVLSGWLGHEAPFAFDLDYRPAAGVERMRVGTPPILQLVALEAALDVWDMVDMQDLRARSLALTDQFIAQVSAACPDLTLVTPRDPAQRGSQVSLRHPQGYAIVQALIAHGVIGDFRAPDILRFGFTPLFTTDDDVSRAVHILAEIMEKRIWDQPQFHTRNAVT